MCTRRCCALKPAWKAALVELLKRYRAGEEMLASEVGSTVWWSLQNRYYVTDVPEVRADRLVHVLKPTPKALAWERCGLLPGKMARKEAHG